MFSLSTKAAFSDPLKVSLIDESALRVANAGTEIARSITLGKPHPNRKYYAFIVSRSNSSSPSAYWVYCRIIIGGVTHNMTKIAGQTSAASSPFAIYELSLPTGEGAASLRFDPSSGVLSYGCVLYEATGRFTRIDFGNGTTSLTLNTKSQGVFMHVSRAFATDLTLQSYTITDINRSVDGLTVRGGRFFPTAEGSRTTTASSTTGTQQLGVTLG
jgi:hypothetical protein